MSNAHIASRLPFETSVAGGALCKGHSTPKVRVLVCHMLGPSPPFPPPFAPNGRLPMQLGESSLASEMPLGESRCYPEVSSPQLTKKRAARHPSLARLGPGPRTSDLVPTDGARMKSVRPASWVMDMRHLCTCADTYIYIYTVIYTVIYMCIYIYASRYVHMYIYIYVYIVLRVSKCIEMCLLYVM